MPNKALLVSMGLLLLSLYEPFMNQRYFVFDTRHETLHPHRAHWIYLIPFSSD